VANDTAKTLNDIPNCAEEQDGNSYYIQKTGVNYICENERWEIVIVKEEEKSSASTAKSSASTAKSSASTAKSSESTAKSSESTAKSSESTAKSSESTAKSSESTAKSSSSTADISENEVEIFDDLPNCTENREGLTYFVKKDNASYQCIYNESKSRVWEKVETCGKTTIHTATHFCVDGKSYEKCGTKTYDPTKEFCADKEIYSLCSGKDYDVSSKECVSGSIKYKAIVDSVMAMQFGHVYFYTKGDSAYIESRYTGDALNPNASKGGCYAMGALWTSWMTALVAEASTMTDAEIKANVSANMIDIFYFYRGAAVESDLDSCDYFSKVIVKNKFSETFTRDNYVKSISIYPFAVTEGVGFSPYTAKEGDYKNCVGTMENSTLTDIESQFCYEGVVYDRCGGSTFATSKPYDPTENVCVDGALVPVEKCGSKPLDKDKQFCVDGKAYDKALYCDNTLSYPTSKYICVAEGSGYAAEVTLSKDDYEECAHAVYAEKKNEFCQDGDVFELCNGVSYDATTYFCYDKGQYEKSKYAVCDDANDVYELNTQFCTTTGIFEKSDYCNADEDQDQYPLTDYYCVDEGGVQTPYAKDEYTIKCGSKYYKTLATGACVATGTTEAGVTTYDYMEIPAPLFVVSEHVEYTTYSYTDGNHVWSGTESGLEDIIYGMIIEGIEDADFTIDGTPPEVDDVETRTYKLEGYKIILVYNKTNGLLEYTGIQIVE